MRWSLNSMRHKNAWLNTTRYAQPDYGLPAPKRAVAVLFIIFLLASCALPHAPLSNTATTPRSEYAKQEQAALLRYVSNQDRLYRIAAPLLVKNASLCSNNARPLLGFTAKNRYSYSITAANTAKNLLRLGEKLQVMNVLDGSGALHAGIRRGDILIKIEDQLFPQGPNAESETAKILVSKLRNTRKLALTILREEKTLNLEIPLTLACAYSIDISNTNHIHAYSDGRRILLTRGRVEFFQADSELATILAREIAHNTLQHIATLQMTTTAAGAIDQLLPMQPDLSGLNTTTSVKSMPAKMDQQADQLALYMLARAGYDPATAGTTLQRLATSHPSAVPNTYTALHPLTTERIHLLKKTVEQIRQKQSAKQPVTP